MSEQFKKINRRTDDAFETKHDPIFARKVSGPVVK